MEVVRPTRSSDGPGPIPLPDEERERKIRMLKTDLRTASKSPYGSVILTTGEIDDYTTYLGNNPDDAPRHLRLFGLIGAGTGRHDCLCKLASMLMVDGAKKRLMLEYGGDETEQFRALMDLVYSAEDEELRGLSARDLTETSD